MGVGEVIMIAAAAGGLAPAHLALRADATVAAPVVRLGDVADLAAAPAPLRARAAAVPVARFRPGQNRIVLTGETVAERARGAMPGLAAWTAGLGGARIRVTRTDASGEATPAAACLRALRAVDGGAVAVAADFQPAPCTARLTTLAYDRATGLARARNALDAGEVIRQPPARTLSAVRPGQDLMLRTVAGPVAIERRVEVVRAARPGAAVVVRSEDGEVFAAPAPGPGRAG